MSGLLPITPILGSKIRLAELLEPIVPQGSRSWGDVQWRPLAFTEASLKRPNNAARNAGLRVTGIRQAAVAKDWSEAR